MTPGGRHLLYVVGTFPQLSETFVANEVLGLADRGHRLTLAFLARGDGPLVSHPAVRLLAVPLLPLALQLPFAGRLRCREPGEIPLRRLYAAAAARWIARRVRGSPPDLVHAHFINRPALVARQVAARLGVPFTVMTHAGDRFGTTAACVRERLGSAGAAFVVSEASRRELAQMIDDAAIAFGPNVHVVRACMGRLDAEQRAVPRHSRALEVVTVARLVAKKGIDAALRAFARLAVLRPDARYRIAGDGPERAGLTALAARLGLSGCVEFLGPLPPAAARELVAGADIALLPCRRMARGDADGIPVSLMEAGAAGVAVVSTRVSGIPELVESGRSGILTESDDVEALGDALIRLGADPALRASMGAALRCRVADEFAPELQLSRLERAWDGVLRSGRASSGL